MNCSPWVMSLERVPFSQERAEFLRSGLISALKVLMEILREKINVNTGNTIWPWLLYPITPPGHSSVTHMYNLPQELILAENEFIDKTTRNTRKYKKNTMKKPFYRKNAKIHILGTRSHKTNLKEALK